MHVTCTTEGCPAYGIDNADAQDTWTDEDGTEHAVDAIVCGYCGATLHTTNREE